MPYDLHRRVPSPPLAGIVATLSGYRERGGGPVCQREASSLVVPLIVSLGSPFRIGLGRSPGARDAQPSFAAGLFPGTVEIESDGAAECVQVDFTPLGAYRFFGGALAGISAAMVPAADLFGRAADILRDEIGNTADWQARFDIAERFVLRRLGPPPRREIAHAYARLARSGGAVTVAALCEDIGWSRKHLAARFTAEVGLPPKQVARMLRFANACATARSGTEAGWASVAAAAGYADQAHLTREFVALAGETPVRWSRRMALLDPRLLRPAP